MSPQMEVRRGPVARRKLERMPRPQPAQEVQPLLGGLLRDHHCPILVIALRSD